jgi:hypothetical protein
MTVTISSRSAGSSGRMIEATSTGSSRHGSWGRVLTQVIKTPLELLGFTRTNELSLLVL